MKPDILLSITSGFLNILAFTIYNWKIIKGKANPNITAWALWAFITVLNFASYKAMSGDWVKSLLPTVSSIQCIITFFLALKTGAKKGGDRNDLLVFILGSIASIVWWSLKSATAANIMLQLAITLGFIPQFKSVWKKPESEIALCWFIWTSSFVLSTIVVILRWRGQPQNLAYPVNCLWMHLTVALLATRSSQPITVS